MNTKIAFSCLSALMLGTTAIAQPNPGTFSVTPKIGLNASTMAGDIGDEYQFDICNISKYYEMQKIVTGTIPEDLYVNKMLLRFDKPQYKIGFTGGVDFQYQISRRWAFVTGLNYSLKRSSFDEKHCDFVYSSSPDFQWETSAVKYRMHYFQLPLLAKCYLYKGLAVNAGIQLGALRQSYINYEGRVKFDNTGTYYIDGITYQDFDQGQWYNIEAELRASDEFRRWEWAIPVGLSYDFGHIVADARADIGMSDFLRDKDVNRRNLTFSVSIGYRFDR